MMRLGLAAMPAAAIAFLSWTAAAEASPITYTDVSSTTSGTLNGQAFTGIVSVTLTGDTSNIKPGPGALAPLLVNPGSATVTVANLGTFVLTNSFGYEVVSTYDAYPVFGSAFTLIAQLDNAQGTSFTGLIGQLDSSFFGYNLQGALGPQSGLNTDPDIQGGSFSSKTISYPTSGGILRFTTPPATSSLTVTGGNGSTVMSNGGTLASPVALSIGTNQVLGSVGGAGGSQAFYQFFWPGGFFSATGSVGSTDPNASLGFDLYGPGGGLLVSDALNFANLGTQTIALNLATGTYVIGFDANNDPPVALTFNTVPEPATLTLTGLGLAGIASRYRRRRSRLDS